MSSEPVKLPLRQPVPAHGEQLSALTLRPVTGRELRTCGVPLVFSKTGATSIETRVATALIAELAAVPPSTVGKLAAADYMGATLAVVNAVSPGMTALVPREPTGADITETGIPVEIGADGSVSIHGASMARAIARLCGLDALAVDALPAAEWMAVAVVVQGFFGPAPTDGSGPTPS